MWIVVLILPAFVLIGSTVIAVLCNERRPLVLLSLGGMVGMVATSLALSLLGLLVGIALATWLVFSVLVLGGLAGAVYWWRARLWQGGLDVSWKYVFLLLVLAGHFGVVAAVSWQYSVGAGVELDNLFSRSAFTSTIARGNFPVFNPYQPDQLLTYRLAFFILGGFRSATREPNRARGTHDVKRRPLCSSLSQRRRFRARCPLWSVAIAARSCALLDHWRFSMATTIADGQS